MLYFVIIFCVCIMGEKIFVFGCCFEGKGGEVMKWEWNYFIHLKTTELVVGVSRWRIIEQKLDKAIEIVKMEKILLKYPAQTKNK